MDGSDLMGISNLMDGSDWIGKEFGIELDEAAHLASEELEHVELSGRGAARMGRGFAPFLADIISLPPCLYDSGIS